MNSRAGLLLACITLSALACNDAGPLDPVAAGARGVQARSDGGSAPILTGSGHHIRLTLGTDPEEMLTTFSFTAVQHADGSVSGHYQYNFRARGFAIHGRVTCVSTNGTQAWAGGTVDQVITDNPAFESLLGLEMWWRSVDNGEGGDAPPDMTTGVGFEIVGNPTTAESWCRTQPAVLPLRVVEHGNVEVRGN